MNKLDFGEGKDGMVAWVDGVVSFKDQSELMKGNTLVLIHVFVFVEVYL